MAGDTLTDGAWWVYMLRCVDGTFYTGITTDIERRIAEHNGYDRLGARYTRGRRPVEVCHVEKAANRSAAARRECEIKRLTRRQKEQLVAGIFGTRGPKADSP